MDAGVEGDRAHELHVPPGRDDDPVLPSDTGFHEELAVADRAVVEQCTQKAVDRVAPEIFGDGEDPVVPGCGVDHLVARADGEGEWLLAEGVETVVEEGGRDAVMESGFDRAGRGFETVDLPRHRRDVVMYSRSGAEEGLRLVGEGVGAAGVEIADGRKFHIMVVGLREFAYSRQVPPSHPAAADDRHAYRFCHASLSPLPLSSPLRLFDGVRIARRWEMSRGWLWV